MTASRVCLYCGLTCIALVFVAGGVWGILNQPAPTVVIIIALGLGAAVWAVTGKAK